MKLWNALKQAFKLYATFSGRTNRPDYWYFMLASAIIGTVLGMVYQVQDTSSNLLGNGDMQVTRPLENAWSLITLLPSLAAGARRLTDAGYKRTELWWLALPLVGWAILAYKLAQPTAATANSN
jgi:uncharacterized membrane protein YhaH (DUF805 family)